MNVAPAFVGREAELTFIDEVGAGERVPEPTPFGDGTAPIGNVHPDAAGYDVIAGLILDALGADDDDGEVSANPGNGGGLHVTGDDATVDLDRTLVRGNAAAGVGGGLYLGDSVLTRSLVTQNVAGTSAGGIFAIAGATVDIGDDTFVTDNDPDDLAGPGSFV